MSEITYKDLKEGDRVKVEIVGVVNYDGWIVCGTGGLLGPSDLSQAKITLLEPELKEGRAEYVYYRAAGRVLYIDGDKAWFRYDDGGMDAVISVPCLRNIPEDTDKGGTDEG